MRFTSYIRLAQVGIAVLGAISATTVLAADTPRPTCDEGSEYHQLNFWIGDWDTFETAAPTSSSIARAQVTAIAGGCAIYERYEQQDGLLGESILSYDPVRKQWQQTWVTNRGTLMVLHGTFADGVLELEGAAHLKNGDTVRQKILWQANEAGVREWAFISKDEGKSWQPAFDVQFKKR